MLWAKNCWENCVKRRRFIKGMGAAAAVAAAPGLQAAEDEGLSILVMGGTGFIGPPTVRALRDAGHRLTLFNRGKTNPGLFPGLELIKGDRLTDDIQQLQGRRWDVVVDTAAYVPRAVNSLMAQLDRDSLRQYVLVSTLSVYANFGTPGIDETAPKAVLDDPDSEDVNQYYGALKFACEEAARAAVPGKVLTIRPGMIVGPGDRTDRFTYWPVRVGRGGRVLAPGEPTDPIQTIDARDLAGWIAHCVGTGLRGEFNATSNAGVTFGDVLSACQQVANPQTELIWVPHDFLLEQAVNEWVDLPFWVNPGGELGGAWTVNTERATAAGLTHRPIGDTIADLYAWWQQQPEERQASLRAGMSAERESEVLAAWAARPAA